MIDWISAVIPCTHFAPVHGGAFISVNAAGEVEFTTRKRVVVRGSFDAGLQLRTYMHAVEPLSHVEISGNPAKFFQGHNLWGSSDLVGLVAATMERLSSYSDLGLIPSREDRAGWYEGIFRLTRVDVTESFHLGSRADVLCWLRAAEQSAHLSHRGRGQLVKGSTLYFGKNSRRWSLKLYSKGQEIQAKAHGQDAILGLPSAVEWANRTLRAELVLRSMELQRLGLASGDAWLIQEQVPFEASALLTDRLGGLTMTTKTTLPDEVLFDLTVAQRTAYLAWRAGNDLRAIMSNGSFYRLRSKLLPFGVDVAFVQPKEASNVIPLVRVLEAVPARVPDWAEGTALYFEPRRVA
jgi:II/X family phage/plasmid replication protein